jgi:fructose-bisphosphate aldolase class II
MLVSMIEPLHEAQQGRFGVVAFNVIGLEHAEAIVAGATRERAPVILQISENAIKYHLGELEPVGLACAELARRAPGRVALHLDHATSFALCERAHAAGFTSVMFDASAMAFDDNIRETKRLAAWAHGAGIAIEGELGVVGGKDGIHSSVDGMTDPARAADYIAATGLDALAVAVGSEHGMRARTARLDLPRIDRIRANVAVPLVLHGASGVADALLAEAIAHGISKVNIATQLNQAYTRAVRASLASDPDVVDPRRYGAEGRDAMIAVVRDRCQFAGASRRDC